jgi:long-chain fatty acid transport protein
VRRALPAAALGALLPALAAASGYEFEGLGARQVSRAGASIADAEDWTAAYWNPGGIVRAAQKGGREVGLEAFGGLAFSRDSNSLSSLPGLGALFSQGRMNSSSVLGGVGFVLPLGRRWGLGGALYTPLLQGSDFSDVSAGGTSLSYKAQAGIVVNNLSVSVEALPSLSLGAGINVLYGKVVTDTEVLNSPLLPGDRLTSRLEGDGTALEGSFGLRWDPDPRLSLGAVYRTGADVPIRGRATAESSLFLPDEASNFRYSLRHPPTAGVGAAWRPAESWTLTMDFTETFWSRFTNELQYDQPGTLLANSANTFRWRDAWKVKLGARRRVGEKTELLAGYSYDRWAVDAASVDFATAVDVPMHRFAAGLARRWGRALETTLGAIGGAGRREEGAVRYRLWGFQLMGEARVRF